MTTHDAEMAKAIRAEARLRNSAHHATVQTLAEGVLWLGLLMVGLAVCVGLIVALAVLGTLGIGGALLGLLAVGIVGVIYVRIACTIIEY